LEISAGKTDPIKAASEALLDHVHSKAGPASDHWQKAGLLASWFGVSKAAHGKTNAKEQAKQAQEEAKKKADEERRAELMVGFELGCEDGKAECSWGCPAARVLGRDLQRACRGKGHSWHAAMSALPDRRIGAARSAWHSYAGPSHGMPSWHQTPEMTSTTAQVLCSDQDGH
jgi:hypothetical protein